MRNAARRFALFFSCAFVAATAIGCGNKAPCKTDPTQVDAARAEAETAATALGSAERDLAAAEARKAELTQELNGMGDAAAQRQRLELLKKGSGR